MCALFARVHDFSRWIFWGGPGWREKERGDQSYPPRAEADSGSPSPKNNEPSTTPMLWLSPTHSTKVHSQDTWLLCFTHAESRITFTSPNLTKKVKHFTFFYYFFYLTHFSLFELESGAPSSEKRVGGRGRLLEAVKGEGAV